MKNTALSLIFVLLFFNANSQAQHKNSATMDFVGRVRCFNDTSGKSSKGAERVIVSPMYMPSLSMTTISDPPGSFIFDSGVPVADLIDKTVTIKYVSTCGIDCALFGAFLGKEKIKKSRADDRLSFPLKEYKFTKQCDEVQIPGDRIDQLLAEMSKQKAIPLTEIKTLVAATVTTVPVLNIPREPKPEVKATENKETTKRSLSFTPLSHTNSLVNPMAAAYPITLESQIAIADLLEEKNMDFGHNGLTSFIHISENMGQIFNPDRNMADAPFTNPSAMGFSTHSSNVSLISNYTHNAKFSAFTHLSDKFSIGGGIVLLSNEKYRTVKYTSGTTSFYFDSTALRSKYTLVQVSPAYRVNEKLSVGASIKMMNQNFSAPRSIRNNFPEISFTDTIIKHTRLDFDVSASVNILPELQMGVNIMNIAGSKAYEDSYVHNEDEVNKNQRSVGLGFLYRTGRLNVGTDILFAHSKLYDASIGFNYVPFNYGLISAGLNFRKWVYTAAFKIKYFRLVYISDPDLLSNTRKPKISFFDGRLYGGFSFDF